MSSRRAARLPTSRVTARTVDAVTRLCEYADAYAFELASYHDACRQLRSILGLSFDEATFAQDVLTRLSPDDKLVARAVRDAQALALLDVDGTGGGS